MERLLAAAFGLLAAAAFGGLGAIFGGAVRAMANYETAFPKLPSAMPSRMEHAVVRSSSP
jgi:hypothetical protein